ncbi:MAG: hypothetical protein KDJ19_03420 [Hyphomicrobiaceae bacterium]|nr:hypothetical protein [Hyphomicrobiaceae bacterium]MCC0025321.1 hypothetical protein [Hyphomicrobiaceae bacterium]
MIWLSTVKRYFNQFKPLRIAAGFLLLVAGTAFAAAPAQAGDTQNALLDSYVGSWSGSGVLQGGEEPETFSCRIEVTNNPQHKLYYNGRCALVRLNLSVRGTILYDDSANRYVAGMSTNRGFSGPVYGRQVGSDIVFAFQKTEVDDDNVEMAVSSQIALRGSKIVIDFTVTFTDSGDKLHTSIPFTR